MKKRIVSIILCAIVILGAIPTIGACAASKYKARSTSQIGINFIEAFEGYARYAFWDYEHYTIGYGNTCTKDQYPAGISEPQAHALFMKMLPSYESGLNSFLKRNDIYVTQNQYDALLSFTFNFGAYVWDREPTIAKYLKNGISKYTDKQIADAFGLWVNAGGQKLEGLVVRRAAEATLFCMNDFSAAYDVYVLTSNTTIRKGTGTGYASVGTFKKGRPISVTAKKYIGTSTWGRVTYNKENRWVNLGSSKFARVANSSTSQFCRSVIYKAENSAKGITLHWTKVPGATGYKLYKKSSPTANWSLYKSFTSKSTVSYTDTSASNGKQYYYYIQSVNGSKTATASGYCYIGFVSAPSLKSITRVSNGIKISWNGQSGASGYKIVRKYATEDDYSVIATVSSSARSYTDEKAAGGNYNYYSVESFNSNGISGYKSALKSIYIGTPKITSTSSTKTSIKVNWSAVSGATGYKLYRKESGGSYSLIKTTSSRSYTNTGISASKTYTYSVRAYSSKITGSYSSGFSTYVVKPATVSKLSNTSSGIKITWGKMSGATGYRLYRKVKGGSYSLIKSISSGSTTSYTDSNVSNGKVYYYKLSTVKSSRYGYTGDEKSITCLKAPNFTSSLVVSSGLQLNWSSISGAKEYIIYKLSDGEYKKLATATTNTYTDKKATKSGTYRYKIQVKTSSGTSPLSSVFTAYSLVKPTLKISKSSNGLKLAWSNYGSAQKIVIYRKLSTDKAYSRYTVVNANTKTFNNTTCVKGKTYNYIVKGLTSKSYSANSDAVTQKYK